MMYRPLVLTFVSYTLLCPASSLSACTNEECDSDFECDDDVPCIVTCTTQGLDQCSLTEVIAPANANLTITCTTTACSDTEITGKSSTTAIYVSCSGSDWSCGEMIINANGAAQVYFVCQGAACQSVLSIDALSSELLVVWARGDGSDSAESYFTGTSVFCPNNFYNTVTEPNISGTYEEVIPNLETYGYGCYFISDSENLNTGHDVLFLAFEGLARDLYFYCADSNCIGTAQLRCATDYATLCSLVQSGTGVECAPSSVCDANIAYTPFPSEQPQTSAPSGIPTLLPSSNPTVIPTFFPSTLPSLTSTDSDGFQSSQSFISTSFSNVEKESTELTSNKSGAQWWPYAVGAGVFCVCAFGLAAACLQYRKHTQAHQHSKMENFTDVTDKKTGGVSDADMASAVPETAGGEAGHQELTATSPDQGEGKSTRVHDSNTGKSVDSETGGMLVEKGMTTTGEDGSIEIIDDNIRNEDEHGGTAKNAQGEKPHRMEKYEIVHIAQPEARDEGFTLR